MQRFRRSSRAADIVMPSPMSGRDYGAVNIVPEPLLDSEKPQTGEPAFAPDASPQSHELHRDGEFWGIFADEGTIGKGTFAKVKKVRHRLSGERFAVKILDKTSELIDVSDLVREVTLFSSLHHPNIVKLFAVYEGTTRLFLLMELAEGGEFMHRLGEDSKTHSEDSVRRHVRTLVRAIAYMHENHFAHRDLKVSLCALNQLFLRALGLLCVLGGPPCLTMSHDAHDALDACTPHPAVLPPARLRRPSSLALLPVTLRH